MRLSTGTAMAGAGSRFTEQLLPCCSARPQRVVGPGIDATSKSVSLGSPRLRRAAVRNKAIARSGAAPLPSFPSVPPSGVFSNPERQQLELLSFLSQLPAAGGGADAVDGAAGALISQGLTLAATSHQVRSTPAAGSLGEDDSDDWAGDGMALPLADVRATSAALEAASQGGDALQRQWAASSAQSGGTPGAMAPPDGSLEHMYAGQQLRAMAKDSETLAQRLGQAASGLAGAATSAASAGRHLGSSAASAAWKAVRGAGAAAVTAKSSGAAPTTGAGGAASAWLAADDAATGTRYVAIAAAPGLPAGSALSRELTSFESYALRTKINRRLYAELAGLYAELHDVVQPVGGDDSPQRVVITGTGLGGSLAKALKLMFVSRGMDPAALGPAVAFDSPPVLCVLPDAAAVAAAGGAGSSDEHLNNLLADFDTDGLLAKLNLAPDALQTVVTPTGTAPGAGPVAAGSKASIGSTVEATGAGGEAAGWLRGLLSKGASAGDAIGPLKRVTLGGLRDKQGRPLQVLSLVGQLVAAEAPLAASV